MCEAMGKKATEKLLLVAFWVLLQVTSGEAGDLVVVWEPNSEPDVAGYILHYGTRPGFYQVSLDVGPRTRVRVGPLQDSVRYYFAVSAYDCWSNESKLSREVAGVPGEGELLPSEFRLYPCFPNPFTRTTTLAFDLPEPTPLEFRIYDLRGKLIKSLRPQRVNAGANPPVVWDGSDENNRPVPAGIYYCQGIAPGFRSRPVAIIRVR